MSKSYIYPLLLLVVFLFHFASNYQILTGSRVVRICDESAVISSGLAWFQESRQPGGLGLSQIWSKLCVLELAQAHPHLFIFTEFWTWKFLYNIRHMKVEWMIWLVNSFYLLILFFSVFGIGKHRFSADVGFVAAILVSFFPAVFGLSRIAMLDLPLMCLVSASFYFLVRTNGFSVLSASIFFGITLGLAEITKETAILFVLPAWMYYCSESFNSDTRSRRIFNILIAVLCFLLVAGCVYLRPENFHIYGTYLDKMAMRVFKPGWRDHIFILVNAIGPLLFFVFCGMSVAFFKDIKKRDRLLMIWLFFPLVLFCLSPNRSLRYVLPVIPAVALLMANEFVRWRLFQQSKKIAIYLLLILLLAQYWLINSGYLDDTKLPNNRYDYFSRGLLSVRYDKDYETSLALLDVFRNDFDGSFRRRIILVAYDLPQMHQLLEQELILAELPFELRAPLVADEVDMGKIAECDRPERVMLVADYVMEKVGYQRAFVTPRRMAVKAEMDRALDNQRENFAFLAKVATTDGSYINIYKRRQ